MRLLTGHTSPPTALALSPDGRRLYSAAQSQRVIRVWDVETGEVERTLRGRHYKGVQSLALSSDGRWLLSAETFAGVAVWHVGGAGEGRRLGEHLDQTSPQPAVAFRPGSALAAWPFWSTAGAEGFGVQLWDVEEGHRRKVIRGHADAVHCLAFSPDGARLASGSGDRTVKLWDHASGRQVRSLKQKVVPGHVAFRPDGKVLAVAGSMSVFVWDVAAGKLMQTLEGHEGSVSALAYSPDGKYLASAGLDGVLILRDALTHEVAGRRHLDLGLPHALAWRADSARLAVGGDRLIGLYEADELPGARQAREPE
jgi:WD40 repeat protein